MSEPAIIIAVFTLAAVYGTTLVGVVTWLNKQFGGIREIMISRSEYDEKHTAMDTRVRNLEIWIARKNGST